jgi:transitional endoplasmic reticulum ATPase
MSDDPSPATREFTVAESYPNDIGRGIARVHSDVFEEFGLDLGDKVEIKGDTTTAGKVWQAKSQSSEKGLLRIDQYTRKNAGVATGEDVTVRRVNAAPAEWVNLGQEVDAFGPGASDFVKRALFKRTVTKGDIVPIATLWNHPFKSSPLSGITMIVDDLHPNEACTITEDTTIEITRKYCD